MCAVGQTMTMLLLLPTRIQIVRQANVLDARTYNILLEKESLLTFAILAASHKSNRQLGWIHFSRSRVCERRLKTIPNFSFYSQLFTKIENEEEQEVREENWPNQ